MKMIRGSLAALLLSVVACSTKDQPQLPQVSCGSMQQLVPYDVTQNAKLVRGVCAQALHLASVCAGGKGQVCSVNGMEVVEEFKLMPLLRKQRLAYIQIHEGPELTDIAVSFGRQGKAELVLNFVFEGGKLNVDSWSVRLP